MRRSARSFSFVDYSSDLSQGTAKFRYELERDDRTMSFEEQLTFVPISDERRRDLPEELIDRVMQNIFLVLGVSYWKLYCPPNITIVPFSLSHAQAQFWDTVYTKGLGEFFFTNRIQLTELVRFPYSDIEVSPPHDQYVTKNRSLVLWGGGKDSVVTVELLKKAKKEFSLFSVDETSLHRNSASLTAKPMISIRRRLDPKLSELIEREEAYDGHVPISAIYAWSAFLAAIFYDYRFVIASNEASASIGNTHYFGAEINHQWSKSLEFEKLFDEYTRRFVTPQITYFSLLRPYTEFALTSMFVKYPSYFHVFSSCNLNFRRDNNSQETLWCGRCAKCAFVFLLLASFLSRNEVLSIFGHNLFDEASLIPIYRELLGLTGIKPFECVGIPEESQFAFYLVDKNGEFSSDVIVSAIRQELSGQYEKIKQFKTMLMLPSGEHRIPKEFLTGIQNL